MALQVSTFAINYRVSAKFYAFGEKHNETGKKFCNSRNERHNNYIYVDFYVILSQENF